MEYTQNQLKEAILYFAKKFQHEQSYVELLKTEVLPSIIDCIIKELFLRKVCIHNSTGEAERYYQIIYDYYSELRTNGFVEFK